MDWKYSLLVNSNNASITILNPFFSITSFLKICKIFKMSKNDFLVLWEMVQKYKTNNIDKKSRRIFVEIFLNKSFHFNSKYKIKLFLPNSIHKGSILDLFKKTYNTFHFSTHFLRKLQKKITT